MITNTKKAMPTALESSRMAAATANCAAGPRPRPSIAPSSGALTAWVSGTPTRAGPMMATVSSMAARDAPKPRRAPCTAPTRASAVPPARATTKPPEGTAREARKDTVATCAGPAISASARAVTRLA